MTQLMWKPRAHSAQRMLKETDGSPEQCVKFAFRLATGRAPHGRGTSDFNRRLSTTATSVCPSTPRSSEIINGGRIAAR